MITLGKYRNDLVDIEDTDLSNYDRIFKIYKYFLEDKEFNVYNLSTKLDFGDIGGDYVSLKSVKSEVPLTIMAHEIYGDIKLWWIIYLCNKEIFGVEAPFTVPTGSQIQYIKPQFLSEMYDEITNQTIYDNQHY